MTDEEPAAESDEEPAAESEELEWADPKELEWADPEKRESLDDAPLSELAARVEERDEIQDSELKNDPFEEMSVPEIDGEALWESITTDDDGDPPGASFVDERAEPIDTEAVEHVVEKKAFCQNCPHLAAPPELSCTHAGTEIAEVVDNEHFRVRNCPVVDD